MTRSDEQRIADIVAFADELASIVGIGEEAFLRDAVARRAAERILELIGEAANAISKALRERYPDVAWRDITRLRVVLAHHYHRVDPQQVWVIATADVPAMISALKA